MKVHLLGEIFAFSVESLITFAKICMDKESLSVINAGINRQNYFQPIC